jgi:hypothetical protein
VYRFVANGQGRLKSPFPTLLPDIEPLKTATAPLVLPPIADASAYRFVVVPGTRFGVDAPSGVPSLHYMPFTDDIAKLSLDIWGAGVVGERCLRRGGGDRECDRGQASSRLCACSRSTVCRRLWLTGR